MVVFDPKSIDDVKRLLSEPKSILILSHNNPDGDALGSSLGMAHWLRSYGHTVQCIYPSMPPSYFSWMPGIADTIYDSEDTRAAIEAKFNTCDVIFCVDFSSAGRIHELDPILVKQTQPKIVIDHHENANPDYFDYYFVEPTCSSASEMVYDFIYTMGGEDRLTLEIAECLYTGLLTDTGGFQYASTHQSSHQMAIKCMELGVRPNKISDLCFNTYSLSRLQLFGYCSLNCLKQIPHKGVTYMWVDRPLMQKFNIQDGDTEGLVNLAMKLQNTKISVLFKEDKDKIRISFRSKGDIDVNRFARTYFEGGGHINAAGGRSLRPMKETLEYFESVVSEYEF